MEAKETIRVMSIMAHQDDFEFNAGGLFAGYQHIVWPLDLGADAVVFERVHQGQGAEP